MNGTMKRAFGAVVSVGMIATLSACNSGAPTAPPASEFQQPAAPADFKGTIKLDVRDSMPDWGPFTPKKAPEGAPNILFVLYDDTGLAAWSPYGGRINMPTLRQAGAEQG